MHEVNNLSQNSTFGFITTYDRNIIVCFCNRLLVIERQKIKFKLSLALFFLHSNQSQVIVKWLNKHSSIRTELKMSKKKGNARPSENLEHYCSRQMI